ncbi:helix-loop-helix DNA-binding domain-containing protein [Coemansia spiralis]|nr:helix-loop-helix DNA-binding domain-containing protein [Coemansia spiralis]
MQQQYTSGALSNIPAGAQLSQQQNDEQNIAALNSFLGISPTSLSLSSPQQSAQIACTNEQAMAAFLASTATAYSDPQALSLPLQDSPIFLNSTGITPAQSIQSIQLGDLGSDAATFAAAASNCLPTCNQTGTGSSSDSPMMAGTADMSNPFLSQSLSAGLESSLNMFCSPVQQSPYNNMTLLPSASLERQQLQQQYFPTSNGANTVLGKHSRAEDAIDYNELQALFAPVGVPLSKRVSMPVLYRGAATFIGDGGPAATMPVSPTSSVMQRISSYRPSINNNASATDGAADNAISSFTPVKKVPISRMKTTTAVMSTSSANTSVFDTNNTNEAANSPPVQYQRKVAHNAIERRYRNNINDRIRDLRNSVPALQSIRQKAKQQISNGVSNDVSNDENDDDLDDDDGDTYVDGVEAAKKLNKATILGKATEYIYYLRRNNDLLKREFIYMRDVLRQIPEGDKLIQKVLQRAKQESDIAAASLHVPENTNVRQKKKRS